MPIGWLPYDDEGYFLITVQGVLDGKPLFDETYSQYGPAYYLTELALRWLGDLPVTHDTGRWAIVGLWTTVCGVSALWVGRMTSSLAWAAVTVAVLGSYTMPQRVNPGVPQWFLLLLLTTFVGLSTSARDDCPRGRIVLAGTGALAAALLLTKINTGTYLTVALVLAVLGSVARRPWTTAAYAVGAVGAAVLPFALMGQDLAAGNIAHPLVASVAIAGCALAAWTGGRRRMRAPGAPLLVAGGFAAGLATLCALALLHGTSLHGLVDGLVLGPANLEDAFWFPRRFPPAVLVPCLASLILCCLVCGAASRRQLAVVLVRVSCAGLAIYAWFFARQYFIAAGPAFVWVILLPSAADGNGWAFARRTLAFAAVLHTLYAYPVPGYQVVWATFLLIPAAVLCIADAVAEVSAMVPGGAGPIVRHALELAVLAAFVAPGPPQPIDPLLRRLAPVDLPGARRVLVAPRLAAQLQWITANLRAHCDTFVSSPGFNSFYFWSGLNPPTGLNAGAWMVLFDHAQQEQIVSALSSYARVCAVRSSKDAAFWLRGRNPAGTDPTTLPLARYIDERFSTVARAAEYEFRLPLAADSASFRNYVLWGDKPFDGTASVRVPAEMLAPEGGITIEAWMRTRHGGVVLACQSSDTLEGRAEESQPVFYVGDDGRLAGQLSASPSGAMRTARPVTDGAWHHAALVASGSAQSFYVDGTLVSRRVDVPVPAALGACQIGTGSTSGWPAAAAEWMPFRGEVADVSVIRRELAAAAVRQDYERGRPSSQPLQQVETSSTASSVAARAPGLGDLETVSARRGAGRGGRADGRPES